MIWPQISVSQNDTHFGSAPADAKEDRQDQTRQTDCSNRAVSLEADCGNNSFRLAVFEATGGHAPGHYYS